MSDALLEAMTGLAADEAVRAIVVTGGAPGYFVRHYSVAALISMGEKLKSSGQQWSEDAPYTPGSFASAMRLVEEMPKPVIAAISGTAMGGAFEFTLACDIRIAQQGDFQIGLRSDSKSATKPLNPLASARLCQRLWQLLFFRLWKED